MLYKAIHYKEREKEERKIYIFILKLYKFYTNCKCYKFAKEKTLTFFFEIY